MSISKTEERSVREIDRAHARFAEAARKDARLGLLFLVDPLRALSDAGVELSKAARKRLRRTLPTAGPGQAGLYDRLARGEGSTYVRCTKVALSNTSA